MSVHKVSIELPAVVDSKFYRSANVDLRELPDAALIHHYEQYGRDEGRTASPGQFRDWYVECLGTGFDCLEIGPFDSPVLIGPRVRYFDVMGRRELMARSKALGRTNRRTPEIHYVHPSGDLGIVETETFDVVFSAHVIEHQPNLVAHLRDVARILRPGGIYVAIIPDKRYCFDHFIPESTVADIIDAHVSGRRTHRLASVVEHRALTCHNDSRRHWAGDHGPYEVSPAVIQAAMREFEAAAGGYVDVHAWQFHPVQFRTVIETLAALRCMALRPVRVYGTRRNELEFIAILERVVAADEDACSPFSGATMQTMSHV